MNTNYKTNKTDRQSLRQQAIRKKEAELKKLTFFDPTYDVVFKKIFEKPKTLIHFLNAILHFDDEHKIISIENLKPTVKLSSLTTKQKTARFDIHARTMDGRFIDIEMQRASHEDFLDRIELYSSLLTINAKITLDNEISKKERTEHPYRMPTVYSIWICNFNVDFCKDYREEFALFRLSDLKKSKPLPVYTKKSYIVIDLTKYVSRKSNSLENEWIELFKKMPTANRIPKGKDEVLEDVYERMRVRNSASTFITEVAADMVTKEEVSTRLGTARREGEAAAKAEAAKTNAARDKKIAKYLRSIGVSPECVATALAIK